MKLELPSDVFNVSSELNEQPELRITALNEPNLSISISRGLLSVSLLLHFGTRDEEVMWPPSERKLQ
jgi:hypothetical protein